LSRSFLGLLGGGLSCPASLEPKPGFRSRAIEITDATLTIGEVAELAKVNASAIRYYERNGLLPEAERVSGQRRFSADTVKRLGIIDVAKQAGFSLEEIGALLDSIDQGAPAHEQLQALAARKLPEVEVLIERAQAMHDWLTMASVCGCDSLESCDLFVGEKAPSRSSPTALSAGS
jgi:MerR family redox-sensitive transcriptional activator SoxR